MPRWIVLLAVTTVGWLLVSVVGGLIFGRILEAASRRLGRSPDPRPF